MKETNNILSVLDSYTLNNPDDIAREIADTFRKRRIEKNLTREQVAEQSGVAVSNIHWLFLVILINVLLHFPYPTTRCSSNIKKASRTSAYFPMLFQLSTLKPVKPNGSASFSQSLVSRFRAVVII